MIGGLLTLKISNKKNENVTASILIWGTLVLLPIALIIEQPWNLSPRLDSTISLFVLRGFFYWISMVIKILYFKTQWFSFPSTSCISNTNFWSYSGIYIFKRSNYFKSNYFIVSCNIRNFYCKKR